MKTFTYDHIHATKPSQLITNDEEFKAAVEFLAEHLNQESFTNSEFTSLELLNYVVLAYFDAHPSAQAIFRASAEMGLALELLAKRLEEFAVEDDE